MHKSLYVILPLLILSGIYFAGTLDSSNPLNPVSQIAELLRNRENNTKSSEILSNKIPKHLRNVNIICICQDNANLYPYFNDETGLVGYVNPAGRMIIEAKFQDGKAFSEGIGAVFDGKRWGYIDTSGSYIIPPQFGGYVGKFETEVNPFVQGTAAVYLGEGNANGFADIQKEKYALIDRKGKIIKKFDCIFPTWQGYGGGKEGEYFAVLNGKNLLVDSDGQILKEYKDEQKDDEESFE